MSVPHSNKKLTWIAATLVALATFIVYLPALHNGFVNWDDHILVYENPTLRSIDIPFVGWALTDVSTGLWHPMLWLSFAFDYTAWGLNPLGYHLTNIVLHTANTLLVFILLVRLIKCGLTQNSKLVTRNVHLIAASVTALLFGIHPLHVESVAWVTERKDVLYSFFFLSSLLVYLKYASTNLIRYYLLSITFFILSLMSKPMAVSLPIVLLILDFYPLGRLAWGREVKDTGLVLLEKLPFLLLSLLLTALTVWIHPGLESQGIYPLTGRMFMVGHSYTYYLFKLAFPFNMAPIYPTLSIPDIFSVEYLAPFIGLATITLLFIRLLEKNKMFSAIWFYYLATLVPILGQVGAQPHADRYLYLPGLGPFLLLGLGIGYLFDECSKKQQAALAAALIFMFGTLANKSLTQIAVWKDSVTLWSYEINLFPDVDIAYNNRGTAYRTLKDQRLAIKDFDTVLKLNPEYTEAYYNRGNAYNSLGNYQQAINDLSKAIELNPPSKRLVSAYNSRGIAYRSLGIHKEAIKDFDMAVKVDPNNQKTYANRGATYMILNEYQEAIKDLSISIKLNPGDAEAYNLRGAAYVNTGDYRQAIKDLDTAIQLDPVSADAYYNRGTAYRRIEDNYRAINDFSMAIRLNSQYAEAYNNRGNAYRDLGNYQQAVEDYSMAIKLNPGDAIAYRNRGIAYKKMGNHEQSVNDFNKADELRHNSNLQSR